MSKKTSPAKNSSAIVAAALTGVLADTYVLAIKTHGYHWNVTGPGFLQLHAFLDAQYTGLFQAADVIAERIRALGSTAPGSMAQFLENTELVEAGAKPPPAQAMLGDLVKTHEKLIQRIDAAIEIADDVDDVASEDVLIQRRAEHDKTLWMLKSLLR